ncbi:hypothetical protein KEM48_012958 [Puccinia striiformis f. sp. tritici PST-130]|nr:hypothetical protein KEM48_012958 [Puccinia striiformis f. sp. tritici PST-130]
MGRRSYRQTSRAAIASAKAGNHEESDLYFSMYRSVSTMKKTGRYETIEVPKLAPPPRTACTKSQAIVSRAQEIVEVSSGEESEAGDLQFADEAMPRHDEMGFTPYFDKKHQDSQRTHPADYLQ